MDFKTAVKSCFSNYVTFSGRASRPEYWWFLLFVFGGQVVLAIVESIIFGTGHGEVGQGYAGYEAHGGPLTGLFSLAVLLPFISVGIRRLHDIGKSGWWYLIGLVPLIGTLVLLYFFVQPSQPGSNAFGPEPARG